jgi:hypothetical protein
MAIYTRFGTKVEIIRVPKDWNRRTLIDVRTEFDNERTVDWRTLKADGGIHEIDAALRESAND